MFSQTVEYALRAGVCLANEAPSGRTTVQIAEMTAVPAAYLSKVLQLLTKGGVVRSQRGVKGGFTLSKQPSEITLLDVVSAVEPMQRIDRCPLGFTVHFDQLCPLHRHLDSAVADLQENFRQTTLADFLAPQGSSTSLCPKQDPPTVDGITPDAPANEST